MFIQNKNKQPLPVFGRFLNNVSITGLGLFLSIFAFGNIALANEDCSSISTLDNSSGFHDLTDSTAGATANGLTGLNSSDHIYQIDVQPGRVLTIGTSTVHFDSYDRIALGTSCENGQAAGSAFDSSDELYYADNYNYSDVNSGTFTATTGLQFDEPNTRAYRFVNNGTTTKTVYWITGGWGMWNSGEYTLSWNISTAPGIPQNLAFTNISNDNHVGLAWSAPSHDGGYSITDYVIQYGSLTDSTACDITTYHSNESATNCQSYGYATVSASSSLAVDLADIPYGTQYKFAVFAINSNGDYSAPANLIISDDCNSTFNLDSGIGAHSLLGTTVGSNSNNLMGRSTPDNIYKIIVPAGRTLTIGQSSVNFDTFNRIAYGTSCTNGQTAGTNFPNNNHLFSATDYNYSSYFSGNFSPTTTIEYDEPGTKAYRYYNDTGENQNIYWVVGGYSSYNLGNFTLNWEISSYPSDVQNFHFTDTNTAGQVGLAWEQPLTNGGYDADQYIIQYGRLDDTGCASNVFSPSGPANCTVGAHGYKVISASGSNTATIDNLPSGYQYKFSIFAINSNGNNSAASTVINGDDCNSIITLDNSAGNHSLSQTTIGTTSNGLNGMSSPDIINQISVPAGKSLTIGHSYTSFDTVSRIARGNYCVNGQPAGSNFSLANTLFRSNDYQYGSYESGTFTETTSLLNDDPNTIAYRFLNNSSEAENIYWVSSGYGSGGTGNITLNWELADLPSSPSASAPDSTTVNLTPGNSQVTVSWSLPNNNGSEISQYDIIYGKAADSCSPSSNDLSGCQTVISISSTNQAFNTRSYTVTNLENDAVYNFAVKSTNSIGSSISSSVSATPTATSTSSPSGSAQGNINVSCNEQGSLQANMVTPDSSGSVNFESRYTNFRDDSTNAPLMESPVLQFIKLVITDDRGYDPGNGNCGTGGDYTLQSSGIYLNGVTTSDPTKHLNLGIDTAATYSNFAWTSGTHSPSGVNEYQSIFSSPSTATPNTNTDNLGTGGWKITTLSEAFSGELTVTLSGDNLVVIRPEGPIEKGDYSGSITITAP